MRVAVINVDGTVEEKELDFGGCQKAVGGYVQLIKLATGIYAYVNEDGISLGLPPNEKATLFCRHVGPDIAISLYIRGPMILVGANGERDVTTRALGLLAALKV